MVLRFWVSSPHFVSAEIAVGVDPMFEFVPFVFCLLDAATQFCTYQILAPHVCFSFKERQTVFSQRLEGLVLFDFDVSGWGSGQSWPITGRE